MQPNQEYIQEMVNTFFQNMGNEVGLAARHELIMLLHVERQQQNPQAMVMLDQVARDMTQGIQNPDMAQEMQNIIMRVAERSPAGRLEHETTGQAADFVFGNDQSLRLERNNTKAILNDPSRVEVNENSIKINLENMAKEEQQKMYKIMLGVATNEKGATILATRPTEFTIAFGEIEGGLGADAVSQNVENRVDKLFENINSQTTIQSAHEEFINEQRQDLAEINVQHFEQKDDFAVDERHKLTQSLQKAIQLELATRTGPSDTIEEKRRDAIKEAQNEGPQPTPVA